MNSGEKQFDENLRRLWCFIMGVILGVVAALTLAKPGNVAGWNNAYREAMFYNCTSEGCPPQ